MGKMQKVYTKEFKEEAVRLAQTSGKPIFTYIETYYNRIRRHSTLGYMSPLHYEQMGELPNVMLRLT
jgi:hypothetical protein